MSSSFTEHLSSLLNTVRPLGLTAVSIGPATQAHTGVMREQCAGPLLPTVPCPIHSAPQHESHAAARSGVWMPRVSVQETMVCHNFVSTQHDRSTPGSQHRHWTCLVALSRSNGRVCSRWAKPLLGQWSGLRADTEYFYNREQLYEITRRKCLYFLLKPPDVLLEAKCRCQGWGRRVLALEMLPLAVVQGQQSPHMRTPASISCSGNPYSLLFTISAAS